MQREQPQIDPYANDPGRWAHSLQNLAEIMLPCLDAAGARSVVEVGAYAGDLTGVLVDWAAGAGARVVAIDPSPQERLVALAEERAELELVRETSLAALPRLAPADAVVIDGDHNHYTVSEELRLIAEAAGAELPLLLFHDVGWPHAPPRRLLRARADPGRAPPADPRGRRAAPGRAGDPLRRPARTAAPPRARAARATAC